MINSYLSTRMTKKDCFKKSNCNVETSRRLGSCIWKATMFFKRDISKYHFFLKFFFVFVDFVCLNSLPARSIVTGRLYWNSHYWEHQFKHLFQWKTNIFVTRPVSPERQKAHPQKFSLPIFWTLSFFLRMCKTFE